MTKVYDKKGNEYNVPHAVDVKEWLDGGYTLEAPKTKSVKQKIEEDEK